MPNSDRRFGVYLDASGTPDTVNSATMQRPGELGMTYDYNDITYQIVKLDSGCTSSTGVGAVAANQLAFWKDKDAYLVTNAPDQAIGGALGTGAQANQVAGIFRNAATAGYYTHIVVRGEEIAVADDTTCDNVGEIAIADTTANVSRVVGIAVGTAPTHRPVGVVRTASADSVTYLDVDIPNIP